MEKQVRNPYPTDKCRGSEEFVRVIKRYLDKMAQEDEAFNAKYTQEGKSIEKCASYIFTQVQKSGCCGFDDAEIYGMAVHYYEEPDEALGEIKNINPSNVIVNHAVALTEEEMNALREEAREQFKKQALDEIKKKYEKPKKQTAVVEENAEEEQLSLF